MNTVNPIREPEKVIKLIKSVSNPRNRLLMVIGFHTGLRISDILPLKIQDLKGERIILISQKTGKRINKKINDELRKQINECLEEWGRINRDNEFVFISQKAINKPMTRQHAGRIIKTECKKAGFKFDVATHTLRKTAGLMIYNLNKSEDEARIFLGHSHVKDTRRYLMLEEEHADHLTEQLSKLLKL